TQLISSLGQRLAEMGRLPLLGQVEYLQPAAGPHPGGYQNSAHRLRALWNRFYLPPPLAQTLSELTGPVLPGG
ncbi:MAG: hypothetical protein ACREN8_07410, partial [Candidatus Dormibacteraceae bacterium]